LAKGDQQQQQEATFDRGHLPLDHLKVMVVKRWCLQIKHNRS
jgi:hypothetical protein